MPNANQAELKTDHTAEVIALLGAERFCQLLDILAQRLRYLMTGLGDGSDTETLIRLVHQSQGSAGALGLLAIAGSLIKLEHLMRAEAGTQNERRQQEIGREPRITRAVEAILAEIHIQHANVTGCKS